jgi:hypothetical protein
MDATRAAIEAAKEYLDAEDTCELSRQQDWKDTAVEGATAVVDDCLNELVRAAQKAGMRWDDAVALARAEEAEGWVTTLEFTWEIRPRGLVNGSHLV